MSQGAERAEPADRERQRGIRWNERTELISVILLSLASIAAAWCGYQASGWSAEQSALYSQASARRLEATTTLTSAYQLALGDAGLFNGWAEAYAVGNEQLMQFYWNRFSPDLETATTAWLALDPLNNPDAPPGPFAMAEYRQTELERVDALEREAGDLFTNGLDASKQSSAYVLSTVLFATVLFFGGLASKVSWAPARLVSIFLAIAMLIAGIIRLSSLPLS